MKEGEGIEMYVSQRHRQQCGDREKGDRVGGDDEGRERGQKETSLWAMGAQCR